MRMREAVCLDVMAETSAYIRRRVYWTNTAMESSTDDSDAYIPGLTKPGNIRQKVRCRKTPEVKANISIDQPVEESAPGKDILVHDLSQSLDSHPRQHSRKASFKDLRIEDKKRVANLIKELARAGDEREKAMSQLQEERQQYENQILQLVAQQEEVLKEREDIQLKLFETQQILTSYQEQIAAEEAQKVKDFQFRPKPVPERLPDGRQSPDIGQQDREPFFSPPARHVSAQLTTLSPRDRHRQTYVNQNVHYNHQNVYPPESVRTQKSDVPNGRQRSTHSRKHLGPLREPIMSSTQKSSQIIDDVSFNSLPTVQSENYLPIPVDDGVSYGQNGFADVKVRNRVNFVENLEDVNGRVHSPILPAETEAIGDPQFLEYYKKLNPTERKQELLEQRASLLEEQKRLKQILTEQEQQLQEKQEILNQRQQLRNHGNFEFNPVLDVDLAQKPIFQNKVKRNLYPVQDTNVQTEVAPVVRRNITDIAKRLDYSGGSMSQSNSGSDSSSHRGRSRLMKSAGTSPLPSQTKASVGTSPVRLDSSADDGPNLVDAETSYSYRHVSRSPQHSIGPPQQHGMTSPQQHNMPLPVNRKRTSPKIKGASSPGDKTLAILEIVNSIEQLDSVLDGSFNSRDENFLLNTSSNNHSREKSLHAPDSPTEDLEESQILEEVFFMK